MLYIGGLWKCRLFVEILGKVQLASTLVRVPVSWGNTRDVCPGPTLLRAPALSHKLAVHGLCKSKLDCLRPCDVILRIVR